MLVNKSVAASLLALLCLCLCAAMLMAAAPSLAQQQQCGGTEPTQCCYPELGNVCYCFDTTSNYWHCGGCQQRCDTNQVCQGGTCVDFNFARATATAAETAAEAEIQDNAGQCEFGETFCEDISFCVDLSSDYWHCGSCNTRCGTNQVCQGGICQDFKF